MDTFCLESAMTASENSPVLQFFENLQLSFLDEFDKGVAQLSVTLKKRPSHFQIATPHESSEDRILAMEPGVPERKMTYSWPGKTPQEAWKFSCILRILSLIFEAVQNNMLITKRCRTLQGAVQLFGTQSVVNTIVDDIAYTVGVDRAALHVISVGKGLAAGAFRIMTKAKNCLDMSVEAVFRRLVHNKYHLNSAAGKGILITGKGYPDICTREFVHLISDIATKNSSSILRGLKITPPTATPRFLALVDGDCDGVAIMSTYKYGSMAHAHASAHLNAPRLEWLGTRIKDVVIEQNRNGNDGEDWAMISLSHRDVKKVRSMLAKNPVFSEDGPELEWRAELQTMMMLNMKAETEVLYGTGGGLEGWIDRKMKDL
ncbi:hypothetical protein UA08_00319 [Talaromyces atroroseus]|uniref:DNA topoisomerase (ATP-hydrolyzing) n=1 Tax=Talaromyces atroroseus TaxID=1441469 RepID=A0A225AWV3_TALAT|nr:hypothetical protein UA08_00319 [Talaromyces atroroseus]OKL64093.1 hypothetical protein UA08_00319 [Talaromyces atroroseus]